MVQKGSNHELKVSPRGKERIQQFLNRAAEDIEFRELLLRDPVKLLSDAKVTGGEKLLSEYDKVLLFSLRRVALEEAGIDVRAARSFLRDNGNCRV
jgi:hypothetical protein